MSESVQSAGVANSSRLGSGADDHRIGGSVTRSGIVLVSILVLVLVGLLGLYAAQTGLGRWQTDEYRYFADHRLLGWKAYFARFEVSPRPFSELLIFGYGAVVLGLGRPLVMAALLFVWGGSLIGMCIAAWVAVRGRWLAAIALGIAPMVFAMQIADVTEMYYWPAATAAYVPMAAAITALLLLLGTEPDARRQAWCGVALGITALSHEMGAAFAIGFAGVAILGGREWRFWWWGPAAAGLAIMAGLVAFRSGIVDLGSDTKPYTGRLVASAVVAGWQTVIDVVSGPDNWWAGVQKIGFGLGIAAIWLRWGAVRPNQWSMAMIGGLLMAVYFSLLAALYHYGDVCCERQASARQWLIVLAFILLGVVVLSRWTQWRRWGDWVGPVIVLAVLVPAIGRIPAIDADFAMLKIAREAREKTWVSTRGSGTAMEFYMPPDGDKMLIQGTSVPVARYVVRDIPPYELMSEVGRFFGKEVVFACQAWQSSRSVLINGKQFIPACPPHDGPPDVFYNPG